MVAWSTDRNLFKPVKLLRTKAMAPQGGRRRTAYDFSTDGGQRADGRAVVSLRPQRQRLKMGMMMVRMARAAGKRPAGR